MRLDLGQALSLRHVVRDADGVLTSATVALTITKPDDSTLTPSIDEISTGVYANVPVLTDMTGIWRYRWAISGTVTDDAEGSVQVLDPAPPAYVAQEVLRSYLGISDTSRDAQIYDARMAAARAIDRKCGRRFWMDPVPVARTIRTKGRVYREPGFGDFVLIVPDIATEDDLVVTGYSSVTTDLGLDGADTITRLYYASTWPDSTVSITARWGWPYVPEEISLANKILAARLFRRKDSPEGIVGSSDWGAIRVTRIDPDVQALIEPFMLSGVA